MTTISPHRIQRTVNSAQFHLKTPEIAGLTATGRDVLGIDVRLVHRLGTNHVTFSAINRTNGKPQDLAWRVVDTMTVDVTIFAPLYDEYDITVIG